jgi:Zn-dependent protease
MLERIPRREWKDLTIAWLAIALAFTLIFVRANIGDLLGFLIFFAISLVTVGIGFVLHEMAHKFTAMRFGFWAEFQKNTQMLLIAVVLAALAGIVFAAPGATVIYGSMSREQNGKISIAGPLTNLILCIPFGLIYLGGVMGSLGLIGLIIGSVGLQVNAMIAFFNMLPVSVLDGRKILSWNLPVFVIMFLATLGVLYLSLTSLYITGISL